MNIKIFAFVTVLLIVVCTVHSQTTIPHHYARTLDNQFHGVHPNQTFATPVDSIIEKLLAHQKQIRSKNTVLSGGQVVIELTETWNNSSWVISSKDSSTYDANGNRTGVVGKVWLDSAWGNSWQDIYTYDANGDETSFLYQTWNGSEWVNAEQWIYTYDANGHETISWWREWNSGILVNYYQSSYTYDAGGHEISELDSVWSNAWIPEYQYIFTYDVNWH